MRTVRAIIMNIVRRIIKFLQQQSLSLSLCSRFKINFGQRICLKFCCVSSLPFVVLGLNFGTREREREASDNGPSIDRNPLQQKFFSGRQARMQIEQTEQDSDVLCMS